MEIKWHGQALLELQDAAEHYEGKQPGLGDAFLAEVERSVGQVERFPEAWPKVSIRSRRIRTRRFPYGLVYQIHTDRITLLAVMHLHRHPDYWRNREE